MIVVELGSEKEENEMSVLDAAFIAHGLFLIVVIVFSLSGLLNNSCQMVR